MSPRLKHHPLSTHGLSHRRVPVRALAPPPRPLPQPLPETACLAPCREMPLRWAWSGDRHKTELKVDMMTACQRVTKKARRPQDKGTTWLRRVDHEGAASRFCLRPSYRPQPRAPVTYFASHLVHSGHIPHSKKAGLFLREE